MREKKRTETKYHPSNCGRCGVTTNTLTKQAGEKCTEGELQNKSKVVRDNRSEQQAERHGHDLAKNIGRGPRQVGFNWVQNERGVKRILSVNHGPGKFPQKPGMKVVVPAPSK